MFITLTGKLGSGKSTACEILKEKYGFAVFYTGQFIRAMAEERGLTLLAFNALLHKESSLNTECDNYVDAQTKKIAQEKAGQKVIFDSRLAWYFVPNSFKVFLTVNPKTAADRVVDTRVFAGEKYKSKQEAYEHLTKRKQMEDERFKVMYGVDCEDFKNFDLIIDTTHLTPDQVVQQILAGYKKHKWI